MGRVNKIVTVKHNFMLPFPFQMVMAVIFLGLLAHLISQPFDTGLSTVLYPPALAFCISVIVARKYVQLDMDKKECFMYTSFFGLRSGKRMRFGAIEKLYINRLTMLHTMPRITTSASFQKTLFKCFLKFDNGEKIMLDEGYNKDKLIRRLRKYNQVLKTTIYDTTSVTPVLVE
jgi:hypothetical protein